MAIHFGTSRWRAVVADEFTFSDVARVTSAICAEFQQPAQAKMVVAHDTRPVGFKFIGEVIHEDKNILGREKSAGLSIKGHYPENHGILACLLAAATILSSLINSPMNLNPTGLVS